MREQEEYFVKKKKFLTASENKNHILCKFAFLLFLCFIISVVTSVYADEPSNDIQMQNGEIIVTISNPFDENKLPGADFYKLILDSEEKIWIAYNAITVASGKKDLDAIADAQKTIRDQLLFNAYQIKKTEIPPDLATMADNYYQSLQSLTQMFDAAYMHNIGKSDYENIQARMKEAEEKSDEYYAMFMQELKTQNSEVYNLIQAMGEA